MTPDSGIPTPAPPQRLTGLASNDIRTGGGIMFLRRELLGFIAIGEINSLGSLIDLGRVLRALVCRIFA